MPRWRERMRAVAAMSLSHPSKSSPLIRIQLRLRVRHSVRRCRPLTLEPRSRAPASRLPLPPRMLALLRRPLRWLPLSPQGATQGRRLRRRKSGVKRRPATAAPDPTQQFLRLSSHRGSMLVRPSKSCRSWRKSPDSMPVSEQTRSTFVFRYWHLTPVTAPILFSGKRSTAPTKVPALTRRRSGRYSARAILDTGTIGNGAILRMSSLRMSLRGVSYQQRMDLLKSSRLLALLKHLPRRKDRIRYRPPAVLDLRSSLLGTSRTEPPSEQFAAERERLVTLSDLPEDQVADHLCHGAPTQVQPEGGS